MLSTLRRFTRPATARAMSTAAAAASKSSGWSFTLKPFTGFAQPQSIKQMIFGESTMPQVPLNIPAMQVPISSSETRVNPEVKVSTLANGVRVVTRDFHVPIVSVGVFVATGSRDESAATSGISHFLETAAFASTRTRTDFRLIRDTSRIGATLSVTAGRESIAYTGEVLANWTQPVVETLGDLVKRPQFIDFELRDLVNHYRESIEEREHKHDVNLLEHVHGAAYGYATLGSPLFAPVSNLANFKRTDVLKQHAAQFFTADRISFVAVGVPHSFAMELAEQEFAELDASVASPAREAAQYVGGDVRMHASPFVHGPYDKKNTHFAVAWKAPHGNSADGVATAVLNALLGDSSSCGSTPKAARAVQTRVNTRLVGAGLVNSASSFNASYSDSALFGVIASAEPGAAANAAYAVVNEVSSLTGNISADELHRAKQSVKHALLYTSDSRSALLNSLGAQLTAGRGPLVSATQLAALVDGVTAADLNRVAGQILKSPLTVAASGDLTKLPRYDQLVAKLN